MVIMSGLSAKAPRTMLSTWALGFAEAGSGADDNNAISAIEQQVRSFLCIKIFYQMETPNGSRLDLGIDFRYTIQAKY
jgi:hypothetical protein